MNLSSSSISIWTMTVPVIGLFSIIALNRASLSTIEWPQKWPRQDTEDVTQWNELYFEGAFLNHRSSYVYHTGWRHFVDNDISWTLFFKVGDFSWTFPKGDFSWTLLVTSRGQF